MDQRSLALQELRTAADLNAELRELKARSRLTYRQLEERAALQGELLPRSTLADVLRNGSLPRQELLVAYVRACGEGDYVDEWLAARKRAAESPARGPAFGGSVGSGVSQTSNGPAAPGSGRPAAKALGSVRRLLRTRRTRVLAGSLLAVALITAATWSLRDPGGSGSSGAVGLPRGHVLLRPLASSGLCVTDGQVTDGRYHSLVAVQRPCVETAPQTTTLDPVGKDAYRIAWYRPDQGKGCLKALTSGPGKGLLEPWDACEQTTAFRFVPTEPRTARRSGTSEKSAGRSYLIRIDDRTCVGIRAASTSAGTEAVAEPCTGADAQLFVVEAAP
ncbi:hypothetical protein [Streptomyces sp. NPDC048521]|uniref:hypothetical protein n=1 Tax=Streptomyces sp. NPDC048521 TaxID=3365566 RepID=UPI0037194617